MWVCWVCGLRRCTVAGRRGQDRSGNWGRDGGGSRRGNGHDDGLGRLWDAATDGATGGGRGVGDVEQSGQKGLGAFEALGLLVEHGLAGGQGGNVGGQGGVLRLGGRGEEEGPHVGSGQGRGCRAVRGGGLRNWCDADHAEDHAVDAAAHGGGSTVERAGGAGRVGVAVGPVGGADGSRGGGGGEGFDQQAASGAAQEGTLILATGPYQTQWGAILAIASRQQVAKPRGVLGQRAEQDVQGGGHGAEGMGGWSEAAVLGRRGSGKTGGRTTEVENTGRLRAATNNEGLAESTPLKPTRGWSTNPADQSSLDPATLHERRASGQAVVKRKRVIGDGQHARANHQHDNLFG